MQTYEEANSRVDILAELVYGLEMSNEERTYNISSRETWSIEGVLQLVYQG
jgi:hypothetical protein